MAKKPEAEAKKKKLCFVIGPIGHEGTETRDKADWLLHFIKTTVEPMDFKVERADEISHPGSITHQIINTIYEADLVIADLTGPNANAFYELAICHSAPKPVVHMIEEGQTIPFDVRDHRAIFYSLRNPEKVGLAMTELVAQIKETEKADFKVSNPISQALAIKKMEASPDEQTRIIAGMSERLSYLEEKVSRNSIADLIARDEFSVPSPVPFSGGLFGSPDNNQNVGGLLAEALLDTQASNKQKLGALGKLAEYNNRIAATTKIAARKRVLAEHKKRTGEGHPFYSKFGQGEEN